MPEDAPEPVIAAHLLMNYGINPYPCSLFELDEHIGGEILRIILSRQSWTDFYLKKIWEQLQIRNTPPKMVPIDEEGEA